MLPPWLEAVVLGIVQGLTEFIPVSSSGHLVLVPYLFGWDKHSLAFDVMLHVGTLGAVLLYFRRELLAIAQGLLGLDRSEVGLTYRRIGLLILPASVPIGLVGLLLADAVAEVFENPLAAACLLLVTAGLLLAAEAVRDRRVAKVEDDSARPSSVAEPVGGRAGGAADGAARQWTGDWRGSPGTAATASPTRPASATDLPTGHDPADPLGGDLSVVGLRGAMLAGLFQCLAVLPGISRSGSTIAGGIFAGLTREAATRFSFLLAIPALVGATVVSLPDIGDGGESLLALGGGMVAAFLSGYAAIRYLVRLVSTGRLTGFAYYCAAAGAIGLVAYAMLGPPSTV